MVLLANLADEAIQGAVLKFDHLAAALAVHVLVLRIAVVMLVEHPRAQFQATQQAGVHQLGERSIDGGPADREAGPLHVIDELLGVEVVVLGEDEAYHVALLAGEALGLGPAGKILPELGLGTLRNFDRSQLNGFTVGCTRVCRREV